MFNLEFYYCSIYRTTYFQYIVGENGVLCSNPLKLSSQRHNERTFKDNFQQQLMYKAFAVGFSCHFCATCRAVCSYQVGCAALGEISPAKTAAGCSYLG